MQRMKNADCPVRKAMNMIGSKWKIRLLEEMRDGEKRYGELKRLVEGISEKMLIQELKDLVEEGLVEKKAYPEIPPRVEYKLTDKGYTAMPVIDTIVAFGKQYL
jgi:DNA-binding HxlR family transcriptional regulator